MPIVIVVLGGGAMCALRASCERQKNAGQFVQQDLSSWNQLCHLNQQRFPEDLCDVLVIESFRSALDGGQDLFGHLVQPIHYVG